MHQKDKMKKLLSMLLSPFMCLSATAATAATPLGPVGSWAVYYGDKASSAQLQAPDLLVLEPDHGWEPATVRREGQRVLAYLSLGEVHEGRAYYKQIAKAAGAIAGKNPDWPGAHRVDPRSPAWRKLVLDVVAPAILAKGYDGLFLDTLDVGAYLEGHGKPGATAAMASLVCDLHARFPAKFLVANGGWALLPQAAGALSGYVTESVYTDYRFKPAAYRPRAMADAAQRAADLHGITERYGLSVLVIEYVDPADEAQRARVAGQVREAGFVPFVSDIGLTTLQPTP
jgi:uncharacterized protein (TIGR01370 family)